MEPPRVEAHHDGGERLKDPDAAEQLKLDGVLLRYEHDERQRAELDGERRYFRDRGLFLSGGARTQKFLLNIARKEVCRGDRHDGRRHERADRDRSKRKSHEPWWEQMQKEGRYGEVRAVLLKARQKRG